MHNKWIKLAVVLLLILLPVMIGAVYRHDTRIPSEMFSAHELREDSAADCFIGMCHALSNKVNAKLSRQRMDRRFDTLTAALAQRASSSWSNDDTGNRNRGINQTFRYAVRCRWA